MDDTPPTNLDDVRKKKGAKRQRSNNSSSNGAAPEAGGKEPKKALIYLNLKYAIDRLFAVQTLPEFPRQFAVYLTHSGARIIIEVLPGGLAAITTEDAVVSAILRYTQLELATLPDYLLTERHAREAMRFWLYSADPIPEPEPFLWQGEEGLTYRRLPWEKLAGPTPLWDRFLERLSNAQAFCDWLGSLFFATSDLQQYCFIHGQGADGKGVINRFLAKVFGSAYRSTDPPGRDDRFWNMGLLGKRLIAFPDCDNVRWVSGQKFKKLTGGDPIEIEQKFKDLFTYQPQAKYLFFSNARPEISSERADTRRPILCEFAPNAPKIEIEGFEEALWAEGGHFLVRCIAGYRERYKGYLPIIPEVDNLTAWISTLEEEFETLFEQAFRLAPGESVTAADMQAIVAGAFDDRRRQLEFRSWLERTHGITKELVRSGGRVLKRYPNLAICNRVTGV